MDSPHPNGMGDIASRVLAYKEFDLERQHDLEQLAEQFMQMKATLGTIRADLEDERETRRNWRKRAEEAELSIKRNQFVLVLVDGDGYIFKEAFLKDASDLGGAQAAQQLYNEVHNYVRTNTQVPLSEFNVMVHVYANKAGLAKTLYEAGMIATPAQLNAFFTAFTRSQPLTHFIDCGPGKERADAKLRETYRFFVYNSHCRHVFLACCHDNGYAAELENYRHDPVAAPKTTLVYAVQPAREYANLPFATTRFASVFEASAGVRAMPKLSQYTQPYQYEAPPREVTPTAYSEEPLTAPQAIVQPPPGLAPSAVPIRSFSQAVNEPVNQSVVRPAEANENKTTGTKSTENPGRIPISRMGERIDRRMRVPTAQDLDDFEERIQYRKLCNEHHLRDNCYQYNCKYDHNEISDNIKNTLRFKARGIPCGTGSRCRRLDCYYGHQCPWGNDKCANTRCAFIKARLHDITDLEVSKFVDPSPGA